MRGEEQRSRPKINCSHVHKLNRLYFEKGGEDGSTLRTVSKGVYMEPKYMIEAYKKLFLVSPRVESKCAFLDTISIKAE